MPQASDELRAKFPGDDAEALEVISKNFNDNKGWITLKDPNYKPTQREWDAVDYLFHEWDYAYEAPKFVEWVEPGENNETVHQRITVKEAVAQMRAAASSLGHEYKSDAEALEDFMTVHWAQFA